VALGKAGTVGSVNHGDVGENRFVLPAERVVELNLARRIGEMII
jgi:hypothetical protein